MEIRSLKQVLHWAFLALGTLSVLMLALSMNTYLDYADGGYGLEATFQDAWLSDGKLYVNLKITNPGGLEMVLGPQCNLTMGSVYSAYVTNGLAKADNTTNLIIPFELSEADLTAIQSSGQASFGFNISVQIEERDVRTNLNISVEGLEVRV